MGLAGSQANLAGDDLFVDLYRLISEERRVTGSHFVDQYTQSPPVDGFVVTLYN